MYGEGISKTGEILDLASKTGLVENLVWYSYDGDRIGQGRENAKIFLKENSEISKKIEDSIRPAKKRIKFEDSSQDVADQEISVD